MKVNNVVFPPQRKPAPPIIFLGRPNVLPVVGGFVAGGLTATAIMDYLFYLSLYKRAEVQYRYVNRI